MFRLGRSLQSQGNQIEILLTVEEGSWFDEAAQWGLQARCLANADSFSTRAHIVRIASELTRSGCDLCFLNHDVLAQAGLELLPESIIAVPIIHNDVQQIYEVACANRNAWNVLVGVSDKIVQHASAMVGVRPIIEIPHGVDTPGPIPQRVLKPSGQPLHLLFAGRLDHKHKGVFFLPMILAECIRRGLECTLTIAGDGSDGIKLLNDFSENGLSSHVTMLGWTDNRRVLAEMRKADILLLPSFFEGFGIALVEAMANGCVPIASLLEGVTDQILVDGQSGFLVKTGDIDGFAAVIEDLANRPETLLDISQAAVTRSREHFSVERMAADYSQLVADAAAGRFPLPRSRTRQVDGSLSTWRDFLPAKIRYFCRGMKKLTKSLPI